MVPTVSFGSAISSGRCLFLKRVCEPRNRSDAIQNPFDYRRGDNVCLKLMKRNIDYIQNDAGKIWFQSKAAGITEKPAAMVRDRPIVHRGSLKTD